jgi:hypothetical protein
MDSGNSAKTTLLACKATIWTSHHSSVGVGFLALTEFALTAQNGLAAFTGLLLRYCVLGMWALIIASATFGHLGRSQQAPHDLTLWF